MVGEDLEFEDSESRESFGDFLKRHREASGKTLDAVCRSTRIPKRYLQAFEESDSSRFPEEAFTRGFLRAYAVEVGMDIEESLARYDRFQRSLQPTQIRDLRKHPRFAELGPKTPILSLKNPLWMISGGVLGVVVVVGLVVMGARRQNTPEPVQDQLEEVESQAEAAPSAEGEAVAAPEAVVAPLVTQSTPLVAPVAPSTLSVKALRKVSFSFRLDDNPSQEMSLDAGEVRTFNVFKSVEVKGISRGSLQVQYNGKAIESSDSNIKLFNRHLFSTPKP